MTLKWSLQAQVAVHQDQYQATLQERARHEHLG